MLVFHDPKRRALARQMLEHKVLRSRLLPHPEDHIPRLPLSEEVNAKITLKSGWTGDVGRGYDGNDNNRARGVFRTPTIGG